MYSCLLFLCVVPRNPAQMAFAQTSFSVVDISTTPVDFGEVYNSATFRGHGTVIVTAPSGTPFAVALSAGANFAAGARQLRKLRGKETVPYSLSSDGGGAQPWGDSDFYGTFPAPSVHRVGTGRPLSITVFGRITVPQMVPAGRYADQVLVSVLF